MCLIVTQWIFSMQVFKPGKPLLFSKKNLRNCWENKSLNELSYQCYCGNKYGSYGTAESKGKNCNKTCTKNVNEICGGHFANSVYQINPSYTTTYTDTTYMQDSLQTSEHSGNSLQ